MLPPTMGFTLLTFDRVAKGLFRFYADKKITLQTTFQSCERRSAFRRLNLCGVPDGGVNSGSAADGLRLIDIGPDYVGHLYSRGNFWRISFLES